MSHDEMSRRDLLKYSLAASAGWGASQFSVPTAKAVDFTQPVPGSDKLTAYQRDGFVMIRWNNSTIVSYRASPEQRYPYFYPLTGPVTGTSLTSESSLPYPHHRGLWLGCEPLNGGDYWSDGNLEKGQIRSVDLRLDDDATTDTSAVFTDRCDWIRAGANSPCSDERTVRVSVPGEHVRLLDISIKLTAHEDISIKKAKHSFFALRSAPDIAPMYGGVLMNSEGGVGAEGTYGQPARWCGYHGPRAARPDVVEGIAIMDHPRNPWAPCPWFTRDYGHLSPSPFNFLKEPWELPKGESILMKYRVVLHAGNPQEAKLDTLYQEWVNTHEL